MTRTRHRLAALLGLAAAACSKETGKYITGPDDPALKVTEKELAQVKEVLAKQDEADKAKGLRKETPPPLAERELPPDHPPVPPAGTSAAAPQAAAAAPSADGTLRVRMLLVNLPPGWESKPPASSMRLAEIVLPAAEGDPEPGQLAVFHFGPESGSVEMNLERWYGQFEQPDGRPTAQAAKRDSFKAGPLDVTLVDVSGTQLPSTMPSAATPRREGWRMLGAIVMAPDGPYYFKATGPEKTMGAQRENMIRLVTSARPAGGTPVNTASVALPPAAPATMPAVPAAAAPAPAAAPTTGSAPAAAPAAPAMPPASAGPAPSAGGGEINLKVMTGTLPAGWTSKPPSSSMRLAEIAIAPSPGDPEPGLISVFYFGPDQGGGVEMNLNRWYGQMAQPDGKPTKDVARVDQIKAGGMDVTLVEAGGTMLASNMPGAPASPERPNWRLLSAIVMTPEGPYFLKGTGPDKTMTENRERMIQFLTGLKLK